MASFLRGSCGEFVKTLANLADEFEFEDLELEWDHFDDYDSECDQLSWDYELDAMENAYLGFGFVVQLVGNNEEVGADELEIEKIDDALSDGIEKMEVEEKEQLDFSKFANVTVGRGGRKNEKPKK